MIIAESYTPKNNIWDFFGPSDGIDDDSWEISIREGVNYSSNLVLTISSMVTDSVRLYLDGDQLISGKSSTDEMKFNFVLRNMRI